MTTKYKEPQILKNISIGRAYINNRNEFAFVGQKLRSSDAWEHNLTYIIFCNVHKQVDERWTVHELEYMTDANGVMGAWCEKPEPMWIFGYKNTGYMVTFSEQKAIATEQIPKRPLRDELLNASFSGITGVKNGHVFTAEIFRGIWKREEKNKWSLLDKGIPQLDYYGADEALSSIHGFRDIAGFSDNDLYACGGDGDLWHYDGDKWYQIDLPTNASLDKICCGSDGQIYITTDINTVVQGIADHWRVIKQDVTDEVFENIVWYQGRCLINTQSAIYEIVDGVFSYSPLNKGMPNPASIIATNDNMLLTASRFFGIQNEISCYDGKEWHKILYRERPPKKPGEKSLLEAMKEFEKNMRDK